MHHLLSLFLLSLHSISSLSLSLSLSFFRPRLMCFLHSKGGNFHTELQPGSGDLDLTPCQKKKKKWKKKKKLCTGRCRHVGVCAVGVDKAARLHSDGLKGFFNAPIGGGVGRFKSVVLDCCLPRPRCVELQLHHPHLAGLHPRPTCLTVIPCSSSLARVRKLICCLFPERAAAALHRTPPPLSSVLFGAFINAEHHVHST